MHKRGWTYFRIAGQVNGKQVYGTGRIPFVYATSQEYYPWLNLQMAGTKIEYADRFTGLSRPWMGLHTIDTVRRDAAQQGVWFETRLVRHEAQGKRHKAGLKAEVVLTHEQTKLIYTIDMEADVIDKITFLSEADEVIGQLEFSYMQDIDRVGSEFAAPRRKSYQRTNLKKQGMLWLFKL